jgi:outer membrane lipoprotein-sorting protein
MTLIAIMGSANGIKASAAQADVMDLVRKVQQVYGKHCCFKATFDQLTVNVAMDLKDRFRGTMYVKKPSKIALDVSWPEKQKVALVGRSYCVYFVQDGNAVRGECPPEMNVEHFFSFFTNIGALDRNFSIQIPSRPIDESGKLLLLELTDQKQPQSTYRIILGIDSKDFTIRRAIIYDALGNYNRFDLSNVTFLESLPESLFIAAPSPGDMLSPFENETPKKRQ